MEAELFYLSSVVLTTCLVAVVGTTLSFASVSVV